MAEASSVQSRVGEGGKEGETWTGNRLILGLGLIIRLGFGSGL